MPVRQKAEPDVGRGVGPCPECAWIVAGEAGELDLQVQALVASAADYAVLARLMPDPMIAVTAAAMLVEAALSGHAEEEFDHPATIQLLAAITRHAPVILVPEDCAERSCEHYTDTCEEGSGQPWEWANPEAAVACAECSLQDGQWAGECEGRYRSECTITAPCAVLTALAAHAEQALAESRRRQQAAAKREAGQAATAASERAADHRISSREG